MSVDREELEKRALDCCPTEDFYELGDCIEAVSDAVLIEIIKQHEDVE